MKLAIMQPYFFPYIGYFQLLNAVDRFVLYDDVQFIKDGWIHRNRLLVNRQAKMFTLPLKKDTYTAKINERMIAAKQWEKERGKLLSTVRQSYVKAPQFEAVYPMVEECLMQSELSLIRFIEYTLNTCCAYLGISTELRRSSSLGVADDAGGQERVIKICRKLNADHYVNAIGGQELYDREAFGHEGISLSFIKTDEIVYPQFGEDFVPWLSIIDVMMFNTPERIREFLGMYKLI